MIRRIKIVYQPPMYSFNADWLIQLVDQYLEFEPWDPTQAYPPGTLFYINYLNFRSLLGREFCQQRVDQGFKVVMDSLWEQPMATTDYYLITNKNWFWYNESLWYRTLKLHNGLGYDQYQPNKKYSKLSLMPIRRQSAIRDHIVDKLGTRLDNFVWSYRDRFLPNDVPSTQDNHQRFFNPEWYDDTYFSTVVETWQAGTCDLISEKIFKPMAYYHPFVVIGQLHTLTRLHELGFETYENLFDESYDDIVNFNQRFDAVINTIDNFKQQPYDSITQKKLQHNHAHFLDQALVESKIVAEIIEPLIHYAETR